MRGPLIIRKLVDRTNHAAADDANLHRVRPRGPNDVITFSHLSRQKPTITLRRSVRGTAGWV